MKINKKFLICSYSNIKFILLKKIIIFILFLPLVVPLYTTKYLDTKVDKESIFYIEKNSSLNYVADKLYHEKLIEKPKIFRIVIRLFFWNKTIKYGEYKIEKDCTYLGILKKFKNHDIYYRAITIPEGFSNNSIFNLLESNEFLSGEIKNKGFIEEGTLMPDTYKFQRGDTRNSIITRMQKSMESFLDTVWDKYNNNYVKTKRDLVILASIIEKETGIPTERKLIASVFLNRLKINMRLQSDPTAIYAYAKGDTTKEKEIKTNLLIKQKNEFNTYRITGLPKTAICNPGRDSIISVLNPTETKYLFFVKDGDGGHTFSSNYSEHLKQIELLKQKIYKNKK